MIAPKPMMSVIALGIILLMSTTASSDHYSGGRSHYGGDHWGGVGVVIGGPFWSPSWYYPPYYPFFFPDFYSPPVTMQSSPPVYIERSEPAPSFIPSSVWYYCPESKTYYPYVRECPGSWQTVPAQPPGMIGR